MRDAGGGRGAPSVRQKVLASITFGDGRSVSVAFVIKRTILCKVARNSDPDPPDYVGAQNRPPNRGRPEHCCSLQISRPARPVPGLPLRLPFPVMPEPASPLLPDL